jgi:hypothetical protein
VLDGIGGRSRASGSIANVKLSHAAAALGLVAAIVALIARERRLDVAVAQSPAAAQARAVDDMAKLATVTPPERAPIATPTDAQAIVADASKTFRVHGRVVSLEGELVRGGDVVAIPMNQHDPLLRQLGSLVTGTGAGLRVSSDGRFEIELDQPSELTYVDAGKSMTVFSALVRDAADAALEQEIVVAPTATIGGIVVDERGEPLRGLTVRERFPAAWLERYAAPDPTRRLCHGIREATTQNHVLPLEPDPGVFWLPAIFVEGAVIEVSDDGDVVARVPMPDRARADLRIVVEREWVRGVVVLADGTPAKGAFVVTDASGTEVDAFGHFEASPGLRVRRDQRLTVLQRDHAPYVIPDFGERWHAGDFQSGLRVVLDAPPRSIRGHLVGVDGAPLAGWEVHDDQAESGFVFHSRWKSNASVFGGIAGPCTTATDGSFALLESTPGEHVLLVRSPPRNVIFETAPVRAGDADLVIRVPSDATVPVVRGRVVTAAGKPLRKIGLTFDPVCAGQEWLGRRGGKFVQTDDDGRFEVHDIARYGTEVGITGLINDIVDWPSRRLVLDDRNEVTLVVSLASNVVFETRRCDTEADRIAFLDAAGKRMDIWEDAPRPASSNTLGPQGPFQVAHLCGDGSFPLVVGSEAVCVVVLAGERELARLPITLDAGLSIGHENVIVWGR